MPPPFTGCSLRNSHRLFWISAALTYVRYRTLQGYVQTRLRHWRSGLEEVGLSLRLEQP